MKPQSFGDCMVRYGTPWLVNTDRLLVLADQFIAGAMSREEFVAAFGKLKDTARAVFEQAHMTYWRADILGAKLGLDPSVFPCRGIYCNRDLVPILDTAFRLLHERGLLHEIKTFDGCFNVRRIRGSADKWSIHSFGLAIDLNAADNPLGGSCAWSPQFLATMKEAGFTLGAEFARVDAMHFQYADNC